MSEKRRSVAVLGGRRLASAGGASGSWTAELDRISSELKALLVDEQVTLLVCAAAAGADLLGLAVAAELGIRCHVILPYEPDVFCQRSVADQGEYWSSLFEKLIPIIAERGDLTVLDLSLEDEVGAYCETNRVLIDDLLAKAAVAEAIAILVWEGKSRGDGDFTGFLQSLARNAGIRECTILTRNP